MKTITTIFALLILGMASGCGMTGKRVGTIQQRTEFSITPPGTTTIVQGQSKIIDVSVNRSPTFTQDITLKAQSSGLSVTPAAQVINAKDSGIAHLQVTVPIGTAVGIYSVNVTGTTSAGWSTSDIANITVAAKK